MSDTPAVAPPSQHQNALMVWLAVFPTLTVLNLAFGPWLGHLPVVVRTFVLASIAVPLVVYVIVPRLHRARAWLLGFRTA